MKALIDVSNSGWICNQLRFYITMVWQLGHASRCRWNQSISGELAATTNMRAENFQSSWNRLKLSDFWQQPPKNKFKASICDLAATGNVSDVLWRGWIELKEMLKSIHETINTNWKIHFLLLRCVHTCTHFTLHIIINFFSLHLFAADIIDISKCWNI